MFDVARIPFRVYSILARIRSCPTQNFVTMYASCLQKYSCPETLPKTVNDNDGKM